MRCYNTYAHFLAGLTCVVIISSRGATNAGASVSQTCTANQGEACVTPCTKILLSSNVQEAPVVVAPLVQVQVSAWQSDPEFTAPTDPNALYVTNPVYPMAHDTPTGENLETVTVPPAPVKS